MNEPDPLRYDDVPNLLPTHSEHGISEAHNMMVLLWSALIRRGKTGPEETLADAAEEIRTYLLSLKRRGLC